MDTESWAEFARLAREAKADMETNEPYALADISVCDDAVTLAEASIADATCTGAPDVLAELDDGASSDGAVADTIWTGDPEALVERLEGATTVAVAVHNDSKPSSFTYLILGGVGESYRLFRNWFAGAAEGARRDALVMHGISSVHAGVAFVLLRERSASDLARLKRTPSR